MGNQSTKNNNVKDEPIAIDRSPGRNRNFCDVLDTKYMKAMEKVRQRVKIFEEASEGEANIDLNLYKGLSRSVSTNFVDSIDECSSLGFQPKIFEVQEYGKPNTTKGNGEPTISKYEDSLYSTDNKNEKENIKPLKYRKKRQRAARSQAQNENVLVKEILNTVTELEHSLQGERQHERRLRRALIQQFQSLQQLRTSLQLEKDRNERLMELMNHYNKEDLNFYANNIEARNDLVDENKRNENKCSDRFSYHDGYSTVSPVLMQQRYEELAQSFANCQNELQKKNHLLNMSHYKHEALQLEYDRLLEELKASEKLISELKRKITSAKKRHISKVREMQGSVSTKLYPPSEPQELILYKEIKLDVEENAPTK